jgi:hypothetical protein
LPTPSQTGEYDVRLAEMSGKQTEMLANMDAHIKADAKAFESTAEGIKGLIAEVKSINEDVKALLNTRSYAFGAWKGAAVIAFALVTIAGLYIAYENLIRTTVSAVSH